MAHLRRFLTFCLVGLTGVLVNMGCLVLLHGVLRLPLTLAAAIAVEVSIISNFLGNNRWTFAGGRPRLGRFLRFNAVSLLGLGITLGVLNLLTGVYGWDYRLANLVAIGAATLCNFLLHTIWTWGNGSGPLLA